MEVSDKMDKYFVLSCKSSIVPENSFIFRLKKELISFKIFYFGFKLFL
jgi:hypothetical protein